MMRDNQPLNPGNGIYNMARIHYRVDPERQYIRHDPDNMKHFQFPGGDMLQMLSMVSIQLAFLRHADRVKIACMTGGLGALCSSDHDNVWRSASHYALMQLITYARGTSLMVSTESETFDIPGYAIDDTSQYRTKEGVNYVDSACAFDEENGRLTIFTVNKNPDDGYDVTLDLKGFGEFGKCTHWEIASDNVPGVAESAANGSAEGGAESAANGGAEGGIKGGIGTESAAVSSFGNDEIFKPVEVKDFRYVGGEFTSYAKPLSWNVFVFEK